MVTTHSRSQTLQKRFWRACSKLRGQRIPGGKTLDVIRGVDVSGHIHGNYDQKMCEIAKVLAETHAFYAYDDRIVMQIGDDLLAKLQTLANRTTVEKNADAILANYFICEILSGKKEEANSVKQFAPPHQLIRSLLLREETREILPCIRHYYRRPIFDDSMNFCGPGWHAHNGTLIHGIAFHPSDLGSTPPTDISILDRLPPHLRYLLRDFCFKTDADLANMVAALITGILANHFVDQGKPIFIFDGNQPGVGKTLLASILGVLLDGEIPAIDEYTDKQDELTKRIDATVRDDNSSVIIFDNARPSSGEAINSPKIEASCGAAVIKGRILGTSNNYRRRNILIWCITMNGAKTSRDLRHRSVPIQLEMVGDPSLRQFEGQDPLSYAMTHRAEILAELFGMVKRYNHDSVEQRNGPGVKHRFAHWASRMASIMAANGLPEFLTNLESATKDFDSDDDILGTLAQDLLKDVGSQRIALDGSNTANLLPVKSMAYQASDLIFRFRSLGLEQERLKQGSSIRSQATTIGKILSGLISKVVTIRFGDVTYVATLHREGGNSNSMKYFFSAVRQCEISEAPVEVSDPSARPKLRPKVT